MDESFLGQTIPATSLSDNAKEIIVNKALEIDNSKVLQEIKEIKTDDEFEKILNQQLENRVKNDKEKFGDNVPDEKTSRWNHIYHNAKEKIKIEKEFNTYKKETEEKLNLLSNLNSELQNKSLQKEQTITNINTNVLSIMESNLIKLQELKKQAKADIDIIKLDDLNDQIYEIRDKIKELKTNTLISNNNSNVQGQDRKDNNNDNIKQELMNKVDIFIKNTPWMNPDDIEFDVDMKQKMLEFDKELIQRVINKKITYEEHLNDIKKKIEKKFNYKKTNNNDNQNAPNLSTATNSIDFNNLNRYNRIDNLTTVEKDVIVRIFKPRTQLEFDGAAKKFRLQQITVEKERNEKGRRI